MLFHGKTRQRCIATLCIEAQNYKDIADCSMPLMARYAERVGAAFRVIGKRVYSHRNSWETNVWEKFQIVDLLETFQKVLYLDLDCVVGAACPDIFEWYEQDDIVCLFDRWVEGPAKTWLKKNGMPEPTIRINSGVMLLGQNVRNHFRMPSVQPEDDERILSEERWFCACFQGSGLPIANIDRRFHDIGLSDSTWIHHALRSKDAEKLDAVRWAAGRIGWSDIPKFDCASL